MAIFDKMFELSDAQSVAMATGSTTSDFVIDFTQADLNMGAGEPLYLNVRMDTALASGTSNSTLQVAVCYDTAAPIDGSSTVIYQTPALSEGDDTAAGKYLLRMPLPYNIDDGRIAGILYSVAGTTSTAGSVDAWIDYGSETDYNTQVSTSNI